MTKDADSVTFLYLLDEDDKTGNMVRWVRPKQRSGIPYANGQFTFQRHFGRFFDYDSYSATNDQ